MMFCPGCAKKDSVPVLETVDKLKGVQTVTACSQKCKIAAALDQSCDYFTWKVFAFAHLRDAIVLEKCSFFEHCSNGGGSTHVQKLCRKLSCVLEVI